MTDNRIDIDDYASDFVHKVTSDASNHTTDFMARVSKVDSKAPASLLLTGGIGMSTEAGEFLEIVKKIFFQGHEYGPKERAMLASELGDVLWYWANACRAVGYSPSDIIRMNVEKLQKRYPGGDFDTILSQFREEEDK